MSIAIKEIEAERAIAQGDEELDMLSPRVHGTGAGDTAYHGVSGKMPKDNFNNGAY